MTRPELLPDGCSATFVRGECPLCGTWEECNTGGANCVCPECEESDG